MQIRAQKICKKYPPWKNGLRKRHFFTEWHQKAIRFKNRPNLKPFSLFARIPCGRTGISQNVATFFLRQRHFLSNVFSYCTPSCCNATAWELRIPIDKLLFSTWLDMTPGLWVLFRLWIRGKSLWQLSGPAQILALYNTAQTGKPRGKNLRSCL